MNIQDRLRDVQEIRRDKTDLKIVIALCQEAADVIDALEKKLNTAVEKESEEK